MNNNINTTIQKQPQHQKLKILTVGDGDLTFSLALKRAYPQHLTIVASTLLPSREELMRTYSNSSETINELQNVWKEDVLFGVDATKLECTLLPSWENHVRESGHISSGTNSSISSDNNDDDLLVDDRNEVHELKFDMIIFNHPHLGDASLHESEQSHAQRHYSLLCHYFHSAKQFLVHGCKQKSSSITNNNGGSSGIEDTVGGRVHVCLCGTQPQTWNVIHAAKHHGLECIHKEKTAAPIHKWLFPNNHHKNSNTLCCGDADKEYQLISSSSPWIEPATVQGHYKAPRRYRNGKLGSKHWLGKYGYRHRRTGGDLFTGNDLDMMVEQSINFIFCEKNVGNDNTKSECINANNDFECLICSMVFKSRDDLDAHLDSPATPDIMLPSNNANALNKIIKEGNEDNVDGKGKSAIKKAKYSNNTNAPNDSSRTNQQILRSSKSFDDTSIPEITLFSTGNHYKLAQDAIGAHFDGKRLRWCCRQKDMSISKHMKSKAHCESMIKSGRVLVNNDLVLDSSRILKTNDIVTLIDSAKSLKIASPSLLSSSRNVLKNKKTEQDHGVKIIKVIPYLDSTKIIIAFKPVGIRTVGTFSDTTLEMIVKTLLSQPDDNIQCKSITKLDTGCAGLCVLFACFGQSMNMLFSTKVLDQVKKIKVCYEFTALVHGSLPCSWDDEIFLKIPDSSGSRRWKKKEKSMNGFSGENISLETDEKIEINNIAGQNGNWVSLKCTDRFNYNINDRIDESTPTTTTLSTVVMKSNHDFGRLSNLLCFLLRKLGHPVVNDRFCKRELTSLPRLMRNILKNKLCIGCYSLRLHEGDGIKANTTEIRINQQCRTLCSFWRETFKINNNNIM